MILKHCGRIIYIEYLWEDEFMLKDKQQLKLLSRILYADKQFMNLNFIRGERKVCVYLFVKLSPF